jgi:hypothetical protein
VRVTCGQQDFFLQLAPARKIEILIYKNAFFKLEPAERFPNSRDRDKFQECLVAAWAVAAGPSLEAAVPASLTWELRLKSGETYNNQNSTQLAEILGKSINSSYA